MKKHHALFFALIITALIAVNYFLFSVQLSPQIEREKVTISRVIDGDTFELDDGRKIRLVNVNTPEKNIPGSELATEFLKSYENEIVEMEAIGTDKYDRTLARIYTPEYLNLELVKRGLSSKFLVQKEELSIFADAEEKAIESSLGIWKRSPYFNCLKSSINQEMEYVTITNNCDNIHIQSWILKDESRKVYEFPNVDIGTITLYTKAGENNEKILFWGSKTDVWNNDRDSLYLFDQEWKIAHYNSYGY
ncbi:MAG: thermonuclease family protein [Nanoarchaeota archaeon]|nr:thermonuclease family protein [Nanoarchaeota archaeon]